MNLKFAAAAAMMAAVFIVGFSYRPPQVAPKVAEGATVVDAPTPELRQSRAQEVPTILQELSPMPDAATASNTAPEGGAPATAAAPEDITPKLAVLDTAGWEKHVGKGLGAWVCVGEQKLYLIEGRKAVWSGPCGTAENGVGSEMGSQKTPLGWHQVAQRLGESAVWGQVFRSRMATHEVWKPGGNTAEDLVLTRVLWLEGVEPGKNKGMNAAGKNVDSKERCIYIHGTNAEERIGTPSSHGCIRLKNDDVIEVFNKMPLGTPVLITE